MPKWFDGIIAEQVGGYLGLRRGHRPRNPNQRHFSRRSSIDNELRKVSPLLLCSLCSPLLLCYFHGSLFFALSDIFYLFSLTGGQALRGYAVRFSDSPARRRGKVSARCP